MRLFIALDWLAGQSAGRCPVGRSLLRLPILIAGCGSFMACGPAGHRGEAWLEKGLLSLVTALPVLADQHLRWDEEEQ
jgi:hypothetical protein